MKKVIWSAPAEVSFDAIIGIINLEQPATAQALAREIKVKTKTLAQFPGLGHKLIFHSNPDQEYRQIIIPPCRVIYLVEEEKITIINVFRTEEMARMVWIVAEQLATYKYQPSSSATTTGSNPPSHL